MNVTSSRLIHDSTRTEKGTDLHHRMKDQMTECANESERRHDRHTKENVGQITDRGKRKPSLDVRLLYGSAAAIDYGKDRSHQA